MDTALYYTFSTVAQALAAALGLLAAVVLFVLERIADRLDDMARNLIGPHGPSDEDMQRRLQLYRRGLHRELHDDLEAWFNSLGTTGAKVQDLETYQHHVERDEKIRRAFRKSAAWTAFVASGAVAGLVATPWLKLRADAVVWGALVLAGVGFIICAAYFWRLVSDVLPAVKAPRAP